jgi:hypothetical protein
MSGPRPLVERPSLSLRERVRVRGNFAWDCIVAAPRLPLQQGIIKRGYHRVWKCSVDLVPEGYI